MIAGFDMVAAAVRWYRLPRATRDEVIELSQTGRVHPDQRVAAAAFAWARFVPNLEHIPVFLLGAGFTLFVTLPFVAFLPIGGAIVAIGIGLFCIPARWARRVLSASIITAASTAEPETAISLEVRRRRLPIAFAARVFLFVLWIVSFLALNLDWPASRVLAIAGFGVVFFGGNILAPRDVGKPLLVLDRNGIHVPTRGFTAPWSAFEPANVDAEANRLWWVARDPAILAGLPRYDTDNVLSQHPVAVCGRSLTVLVDRMRERPEDVLRATWALAKPQ